MKLSMYLSGVIALISTVCYLLFKQNKKNKALYLSEVDKNKALEGEIDKLKKLEKVKNDARKETEQKIDEVDSRSGIDRFNAINDVLSDNS